MHVSACTRPRARVTTCTHARSSMHTQTICSTYCFSTSTMVLWTRLSVTLHIHCLSCWICSGFLLQEMRSTKESLSGTPQMLLNTVRRSLNHQFKRWHNPLANTITNLNNSSVNTKKRCVVATCLLALGNKRTGVVSLEFISYKNVHSCSKVILFTEMYYVRIEKHFEIFIVVFWITKAPSLLHR
jgi:hypothetical protein